MGEIKALTLVTDDLAGKGPTVGPADQLPNYMPLETGPRGWTKVYDEDFSNGLVLSSDSAAGWEPKFAHGANWLNGDSEKQCYVTPAIKEKGITYNPFSIETICGRNFCGITPRKATASEKAITSKDYLSGVLRRRETCTFGMWEATVIFPCFNGEFSAAWLMNNPWLPEVDIVEHLTGGTAKHGSNKYFINAHWGDGTLQANGKPRQYSKNASGGDVSADRPLYLANRFAAIVTPGFIGYYFNERLISSLVNPPATALVEGVRAPMHFVINMALGGGDWGGSIDDSRLAPLYFTDVKLWKMPT